MIDPEAEAEGVSAATVVHDALMARRDGRSELAERLSDAPLRMLAALFGGDETGAGHTEELRCALCHMEEPRMSAETVAQWLREAGHVQGERTLLRCQAARRFSTATGDALAVLLAPLASLERSQAHMGRALTACGKPHQRSHLPRQPTRTVATRTGDTVRSRLLRE